MIISLSGSEQYIISVRKNGSNSAASVTFTSSSGQKLTSTGIVAFEKGDKISIKSEASGNPSPTRFAMGWMIGEMSGSGHSFGVII